MSGREDGEMDGSFRGCGNTERVFKEGSSRCCLKAVEWSFREGLH